MSILGRTISSSISLPVSSSLRGVFVGLAGLTSFPLDIETMVDEEGLAVKTGMGPTRDVLGEVLVLSKLVILLKNVVPIAV
jgi:hypothetical protein